MAATLLEWQWEIFLIKNYKKIYKTLKFFYLLPILLIELKVRQTERSAGAFLLTIYVVQEDDNKLTKNQGGISHGFSSKK